MRRYPVLVLAALAAFGDCLRGSFHFDDYSLLAGQWTNWGLLQTRPLTQLTFWLNHAVLGDAAWGYHAVNLLLHVAAVLLFYRVLGEGGFLPALVFAVHPLQSEAVAYVFARGTLLAAVFCLLSWLCWKRNRFWAATAWFGAALLCQQICVTFPLFLLLIGARVWKPAAAMLGMAGAAGLRTLYATSAVAGAGAGFSAGVSPIEYFAAQGTAILRYFRLVVLPWGLTIDPEIAAHAWAWVALIVIAVLLRRNVWFLGGLILLIPSSSFFPAADLAADRRMYLPMLAFCGLVPPLRKWIAGAVVVTLTALSIGRMEVWRTERTLWEEAVERSPGKARPRIQLARTVPAGEALRILKDAPATADVMAERGRVYLDLGQPGDALREFGRALAMKPGDAHAINNRGAALLALGQPEAARRDFEAALQIDPGLAEAKANLRRAATAPK